MIIQEFMIKGYDWNVIVFYADGGYFINPIINALREIGCNEDDIDTAREFLELNNVDNGFTFTVPFTRSSVLFIGETKSGEQFQSTYDHEKGHLAMHMASYLGIEPFGEEYQYLVGEIGRLMYEVAHMFICKDWDN